MLLVNSVGYFNSLKLKDCGFMLSSLLVVSLGAGCLFIMLVVFVYCGRCLFVVEFGLRFGSLLRFLDWLGWFGGGDFGDFGVIWVFAMDFRFDFSFWGGCEHVFIVCFLGLGFMWFATRYFCGFGLGGGRGACWLCACWFVAFRVC